MSVSLYTLRDRGGEKDYPSWVDGAPNLQTYLTALNKSQPIIQCQYELVWSRWPRAKFFSKNITIPGLEVNTQELNHAGFTIKIPTHVHYESNEITLNIIADKEGFHYYDLRNMVFQTGHPLVAGDPKSTIGNPYGVSPDEDTIEVRLRNRPSDETHHHWIIHNFKPIGLGDIELSQDSGSFVEFELKGTFTHISYDCGKVLPPEEPPAPAQEDVPPEEPEEPYEDEEYPYEDEEEEEPEEPDEEEEEEEDWDSEIHEDIESESMSVDSDSEIDIDVQEDDNGEIPPEDQSLADTLNEKQNENVDNLNADLQNIADGDEDTLLDDDAKAAKQILEENGGDREQAKEQLTEKILSENPGMDSDEAELTAEQALRDAEDFKQIHSQENEGQAQENEGQGGETSSDEEQQTPSPPKTIDENVSIKEDTPREGQNAQAHSDYAEMDDDSKAAVDVLKDCGGDVGAAEDKMYEKIQKENPDMDSDDVRNAAEMAVMEAQSYTEKHGSEPPKPVDTVQVETKVDGTAQTELQKNATHEAVQEYKEKTEQTIDAYKNAKQNVPLEGHSAEALDLFNQHQGDKTKVEEAIQQKIQRENPNMDSDEVQEKVDIAMLEAEFEYSKQKPRKGSVIATRGQINRKGNVLKITQLTLPQRFGLYRTPTKDVPKTTEIELEDPQNNFIDSTSSRLAKNPNHKVRGIFD